MNGFFKLDRQHIPMLYKYIQENQYACYDMHLALSDAGQVKLSATAYGYGDGTQLKGLAIFQAGGTMSCHFQDSGVFSKVDFLKALKLHRPSTIKAQREIVEKLVQMLTRTMDWYELEHCHLMRLSRGGVTHPSANQLKLMNGTETVFSDVVGFMVEVERAFGRARMTVNQLKEKLEQTPAYLFAFAEEEVVAQAVIEYQTEETAQLGGVYVKPKYRGRGIGTHLSQELSARQLSHVREVTLLVRQDNGAAVASYKKIGFEPVEEISRLHLQLR